MKSSPNSEGSLWRSFRRPWLVKRSTFWFARGGSTSRLALRECDALEWTVRRPNSCAISRRSLCWAKCEDSISLIGPLHYAQDKHARNWTIKRWQGGFPEIAHGWAESRRRLIQADCWTKGSRQRTDQTGEFHVRHEQNIHHFFGFLLVP